MFQSFYLSLRGCLSVVAISLFIVSCAEQQPVRDEFATAQAAYEKGLTHKNKKRWEDAIASFQDVKFRYPLSPFAKKAELDLADVYYLKKDYIESRSAYELFVKFHPSDANIPFVQYRIGLTYYQEMPKTVDRDEGPVLKTIEVLSDFIKSYPKSSYKADTQDKLREARQWMMHHILYIAHYYYKTKEYKAALARALDIIEKYPGFPQREKAYFYIISCYNRLKEVENARKYLQKLKQEFPNSSFINDFE
ncbi:MAG: outer membrane protein assembly factor BamD [Deltaproteobacteria bacterium]|nr:outer membrane protein assembly factor BamD [Deltaproteobacteria bacterium]